MRCPPPTELNVDDSGAPLPLQEKKRVIVSYKGHEFPLVWRRNTSPELLQARLSRLLDPTIDPRSLVLIDGDMEECDLCDALEVSACAMILTALSVLSL